MINMNAILHLTLIQSLTNTADESQKKNQTDQQPGQQRNLLISRRDHLHLVKDDLKHRLEEDVTIDLDHHVAELLQHTDHLHLVINPALGHQSEKSTKRIAAVHQVPLKESNLPRNLQVNHLLCHLP